MADSMFHQPVMGRRAFVGGTLAASSMAFLAPSRSPRFLHASAMLLR